MDQNALSETDLLKLQLLISKRGKLDAEYQAQSLHLQILLGELNRHLASHYGLSLGDEVDAETGAIKRKPKE